MKNHPLIAGTVIVVVIACVVLVFSLHRQDKPLSSITPSQSSSEASPATSTASASQTVPEASSSKPGVPATTGTSVSEAACTAGDIQGSASFQGGGQSVVGTVKITARSGTDCSLSGVPKLSLISDTTILPISQHDTGAGGAVVVNASHNANSSFMWSNWCGSAITQALEVKVVLADGTYLQIPFISPQGKPQTGNPICQASNQPSTLSVQPYSAS